MRRADLVAGGYAPQWLARETILGQSIELGVVDDGTSNRIPMVFAVASPSRSLSRSSAEGFRAGAAMGGVIGVESLGTELGAETFSGSRRSGMEHALGRTLARDDLVSVADLGVVYDERVVYRRQQPGRAYLSEMRTSLSFAPGAGIRNGGVVKAPEVKSFGTFVVGRLADVSGDSVAGEARGGEDATFDGDFVQGNELAILDTLTRTPQWRITGVLKAGRGQAGREIRASRVNATSSLEAGPVLAVDGDVEASRTLHGKSVSASVVSGAAADGLSGTVRVSQQVEGAYGVADTLRLDGVIEVTGQCYGCAPEGA